MTEWDGLAGWWAAEVAGDPAYADQVVPLLIEVLEPQPSRLYLDVGCGEGQVARAVAATGAAVVGTDFNAELAATAVATTPVVRARLPELGWLADGTVDGAYAVLVLEHLPSVASLFAELARVVRGGGTMAVVVNHPVFTAPGSGPFIDPVDGEVLWRWGAYLEPGSTREPAGEDTVTFHHRPLGDLVGAAAAAGWSLQTLLERPLDTPGSRNDPVLAAQQYVPRLAALRWSRTGGRYDRRR